jgi:hypothetical protein
MNSKRQLISWKEHCRVTPDVPYHGMLYSNYRERNRNQEQGGRERKRRKSHVKLIQGCIQLKIIKFQNSLFAQSHLL